MYLGNFRSGPIIRAKRESTVEKSKSFVKQNTETTQTDYFESYKSQGGESTTNNISINFNPEKTFQEINYKTETEFPIVFRYLF